MRTMIFTITVTDDYPLDDIITEVLDLFESKCSCVTTSGEFDDEEDAEHTWQFGAVHTYGHTDQEYVDFDATVRNANAETDAFLDAIVTADEVTHTVD